MDFGRFFVMAGGWFDWACTNLVWSLGFRYGWYSPVSKFKVTSRKLTAFRLASIVIFSPMVLNISIMSFLVLSAFGPLVLSTTANTKSYVIYQYTCSCAETYVGKTTQRLSERTKQHIPPNIATRKSNQADSAILAHIRNKPACVPTNAQERFRILARARSSYHLDILEAMYIRSLEPSLCAQKEFVKSLTLFT